jgi:hypothetical protein
MSVAETMLTKSLTSAMVERRISTVFMGFSPFLYFHFYYSVCRGSCQYFFAFTGLLTNSGIRSDHFMSSFAKVKKQSDLITFAQEKTFVCS